MTVEELKVLITAETSGLKKEIKKVQNELSGLEKTATKASKSISSSFKGLFKGFSVAAVLVGLNKLANQAISTASSLEEVQNVVEQSFGSATEEINEFARNALKQFGLSELSAKQMSSTFMAMSNGMQISSSTGKVMAKTLTGLAGDLASFYDVESSVAKTALQSVFTGETESLKKFGIVLTEANLQQFAYSQGITKSVSSMTQAEKVMLRYQYVLNATNKVQGDFARTSNSWANQTRILKEQWSQLLGILGKGLINVLTPMVKVLNEMLSSLISIANAFAKAFGGSGIQKSTSTVQSGIDGITGSAGDATEGIEGTTDAAKQLAKTVAGFDELNILGSNTSSSGSSGSSSLEASGSVIEGPEYESPAVKASEYLNELKEIVLGWVDKIPKLEINFDKEKAIEDLQGIGKNITNVIAGWGSFAVSVVIQLANDLDIGALTNSFLNLTNSATGLASAITDTLVPALQTFYIESGLQDIVQWIGQKIKDAMDGAAGKMDDWAQWFIDNKEKINEFASNLGKLLQPISELVIKIGDAAWVIFADILDKIDTALRNIADSLVNLSFEQLEKLRDLILTIAGGFVGINIGKMITSMFKDIDLDGIGAVFAYIEGYITGDGKLTTLFTTFGTKIKSVFSGIGTIFTNLGATLLPVLISMQSGYSNTVNQIGASSSIFTKVKGIVAGVSDGFSALWKIILAHPFAVVVAAITLAIASLVHLYNNSEDFRNFVQSLWDDTIKPVVENIKEKISDLWNNTLKPFWEESLKPLLKQVGSGLSNLWDTVSTVIGWIIGIVGGSLLTTVVNVLGTIITFVIDIIQGITEILGGLIDFITGVFTGDWKKAWEGVKKIFKGIFDSLDGVVKVPFNIIIGLINGLLKGITSGVNLAIRAINKLNIKVPDWIPGIGGKSFGFNISELTAPQILPLLANGGIIDSPTVAMLGEYAGASNNPEIAAPQALLQQIINSSNQNIVEALIQQTRQLIAVLEQMDLDVSIGDEVIARAAQRGNQNYKRRTGKPLLT